MFVQERLVEEIVALGYSDSYVVSPPVFRIQCSNLAQLMICVQKIGRYNDFISQIIVQKLRLFEKFPLGVCAFFIGRESSPVIYISIIDQRQIQEFQKICVQFAQETSATESDFYDGPKGHECRIYWS